MSIPLTRMEGPVQPTPGKTLGPKRPLQEFDLEVPLDFNAEALLGRIQDRMQMHSPMLVLSRHVENRDESVIVDGICTVKVDSPRGNSRADIVVRGPIECPIFKVNRQGVIQVSNASKGERWDIAKVQAHKPLFTVTLLSIARGKVRLGFEADYSVRIFRSELIKEVGAITTGGLVLPCKLGETIAVWGPLPEAMISNDQAVKQ